MIYLCLEPTLKHDRPHSRELCKLKYDVNFKFNNEDRQFEQDEDQKQEFC